MSVNKSGEQFLNKRCEKVVTKICEQKFWIKVVCITCEHKLWKSSEQELCTSVEKRAVKKILNKSSDKSYELEFWSGVVNKFCDR